MARALQDLIGKKVSHYRVREATGSGGMGIIFQAEDPSWVGAWRLSFCQKNWPAIQCPFNVSNARRRLNHPNIYTIYEIEEHEGRPFIAMEFLEGYTLHHRMTTPELVAFPLVPLVDIAVQVCDGLQAAYDKGIIHRDIKPANLFVTKQGIVKILDFGVAKLSASGDREEERDVADASRHTAPSVVSRLRCGCSS